MYNHNPQSCPQNAKEPANTAIQDAAAAIQDADAAFAVACSGLTRVS